MLNYGQAHTLFVVIILNSVVTESTELSGSHRAVVGQSWVSVGPKAVIWHWQLSGSRQGVVRQLSCSRQGKIYVKKGFDLHSKVL